MIEEAAKGLIQAGILGVVLVLVGAYLLWLQREYRKDVALLQAQLKESLEKRVTDAQAVVDRMLTVTERHNTTMATLNVTMMQQANAMEELREDLRRSRGA